MSDNIELSPEARWRHLREHGTKVLVDLSSNDLISNKPAWLDEDRFARAKAAVEQYYVGIVYSSLTGLLLILQLPDGLEPLLVTGNSKDIPSLYKRYLSTILHVSSWYEDDIFNPETRGYKSIRQVRSMHKRVQDLMNQRHRVRDVHGKEHLWMTQYDVALTQFAFIGLAMLFPRKSALIAAKPEELELISYYWRVLGYMMGLKDEFNLCHFDKYDDIHQFNKLVFDREYVQKFKEQPCPMGLEMTKSICVALQYFTPLITFNSLAHWWSDCFSFNGYELQPKTRKDKLLLMWTSLSFNQLLKTQTFLKFSNKLHKRRFARRLTRRDEVYNGLKEQYKDCPAFTYYSTRVDYFNKSAPIRGRIDEDNNNNSNDNNNSSSNNNNNNNNNNNDNNNSSSSNNNNNNNNNNNEPVSVKPTVSPIATNTFSGCPMGYDAVLPALYPEPIRSA